LLLDLIHAGPSSTGSLQILLRDGEWQAVELDDLSIIPGPVILFPAAGGGVNLA
jgi:hypothetical protein